jgi:hypothetical protein
MSVNSNWHVIMKVEGHMLIFILLRLYSAPALINTSLKVGKIFFTLLD